MIKEKKKKDRFGAQKTKRQILLEYGRTVLISFLLALVFTILLSIHARSEMIKNLYENTNEQRRMNEQIARQLIMQSDLTKDLKKKSYAVCMQVGNIYELAHEYKNAQFAYEIALEKSGYGSYSSYYKLTKVLIAQEKFDEAQNVIKSVKDISDKNLIKYKSRAYIEMGDKYYSIGKFLSAAKSYEKAKFYYDKFTRKDPVVESSIKNRIVNAYIETADIMVKSCLNSDAVRFLTKAEKYLPDNFNIKYKLAIIYSDLDPVKSVEYFEPLLKEKPQQIDYGVYSKALMKSANIMDLEGKPTRAKYYRYKIHSIDIFVNQKVVYKNDIEVLLDKFIVRKPWFTYRLKAAYRFKNVSHTNIRNMSADFVLRREDKVLETISVKCVGKSAPLYSNGGVTEEIKIVFDKNIFTKNELSQYLIDIYLYKDEKYKTLVSTMKVPLKTINNTK